MSRRSEENRLRKAAEAGDMEAASELAGMLREDGDLYGAAQWNRRAAEAGSHDGIVDLGIVLCQMGKFDEAEPWLRKGVEDPRHAEVPGFCEYLLGRCLADLQKFDEAEQWLAIGAAANIEDALEQLEKLREYRAEQAAQAERQGSGSDVLQTFEVDSVMFYDGSGHRLGQSVCTLTKTRLIIDDARGGISQIQLSNITGVRSMLRKMLRVEAPGVAYDIYCVSKDQKNLLAARLSDAIRGA